MRLALGKWGSLEDTDEEITLDSVDMDNDRSEEVHEDTRRRRRPRRSYGSGGSGYSRGGDRGFSGDRGRSRDRERTRW